MKVFQAFVYINVGAGALFFMIWFFTSVPLFQQTAFAETTKAVKNNAPSVNKKSAVTAKAPDQPINATGKPAKSASAQPSAKEQASAKKPVNAPAKSASAQPSAKEQASAKKPVNAPAKSASAQPSAKEQVSNQQGPANAPAKSASAQPSATKGQVSNQGPANAPAKSASAQPSATKGQVSANKPVAPAPNVKSTPSGAAPQPARREVSSVAGVPPPPPIPASEEDDPVLLPPNTATATGGANKDHKAPNNEKDSTELNKILESANRLKSSKTAGSSAADDVVKINRRIADIYKVLNSYHYDSTNRRDPFKAFDVPSDEDSMESGKTAPIPNYPTGQYSLSEIKLVGIKWNSKIGPSKALFKTPDNTLHYLQKK